MANSKSQQYEVIKNGPLCLDKYCADIVPFGQGFNNKNSPLLGGAISNVFSKENRNISQYVSNGNHEAWLGTDNYIYIDGKKTQRFIETNERYKFVVDTIEGIDESYLDYWDSNNYLRVINNSTTLEYKLNGSSHTTDYSISHTYKIIETEDNVRFLVEVIPDVTPNVYAGTSVLNIDLSIYDNQGTRVYYQDNALAYPPSVDYNNIIIRFGRLRGQTGDVNKYFLIIYLTNSKGEIAIKNGVLPVGYIDPIYSIKYLAYFDNVWCRTFTPDLYRGSTFLYKANDGRIDAVGFYIESELLAQDQYLYIYRCTNDGIYTYNSETAYVGYAWSDDYRVRSDGILAYSSIAMSTNSTFACLYSSPFIENLTGFRTIFKNENSGGNEPSVIYCKDITWGSLYSYGSTDDYSLSALVGDLASDSYPLPKPAFNKRLIIGDWYPTQAASNNPGYYYEVLVDKNNKIQSFSYTYGAKDELGYTCNNLGTLLVPIGSVSNERPFHYMPGSSYYQRQSKILVYFDAYDKVWKKIHPESGIDLEIVDDYLLINTLSRYNAININDLTNQIWANDWNNRFVKSDGVYSGDVQINGSYFSSPTYGFLKFDNFLASKKEIKLSSAYNYSIDSSNIPSSQLPEETVYLYTTLVSDVSKATPDETYYSTLRNMGSGCDIYDLEIYKNGIYNNSIYSNVISHYYTETAVFEYLYNVDLAGKDYLVDSLYYTPAITMKIKETYSNKNLVSFDKLIYSLQYYGDMRKEKLVYALTTQYYGIEDIFIIQGQGYFTQNNKIYSFKVSTDYSTIESVNFITNIQGLKFKAATTKEAYFWSKNDSSLYVFTADNILRKLYTATDITDIYDAIYYPSLDVTVFDTNIGLLCLNDNFGMFCISNTNNGHLYLNPNGYITLFSNRLYYYNLWFLDNTWTKNDIILATKFYGLGSNLISITDTWYFRLFADKSLYEQIGLDRSGKLKLSVDALTDQGLSTEVKEIDIKDSDWDELTDTLYIRYQPKLQRGVGVSLNVESPFAIGYLGLGNIAETTQMSRPSMQA